MKENSVEDERMVEREKVGENNSETVGRKNERTLTSPKEKKPKKLKKRKERNDRRKCQLILKIQMVMWCLDVL